MMLTPQAHRLVSEAVRYLADPKAREKWRSWAERTRREHIPADLAPIALDALDSVSRELERRLASRELDEDTEADVLNDLGFIRAIATDLRREVSSARAD